MEERSRTCNGRGAISPLLTVGSPLLFSSLCVLCVSAVQIKKSLGAKGVILAIATITATNLKRAIARSEHYNPLKRV